MAKFDLEVLEDALIDFIKDDLPAKASEINRERVDAISDNLSEDILDDDGLAILQDGLAIEVLPDSSYFSTFSEEVNNVDKWIYYGYSDIAQEGNGPATIQGFTFFVIVYIENLNNSVPSENRKLVFRYTRAFTEIMNSNFKELGIVSQLKVTGIAPQLYEDNETSAKINVGGVLISGSYT